MVSTLLPLRAKRTVKNVSIFRAWSRLFVYISHQSRFYEQGLRRCCGRTVDAITASAVRISPYFSRSTRDRAVSERRSRYVASLVLSLRLSGWSWQQTHETEVKAWRGKWKLYRLSVSLAVAEPWTSPAANIVRTSPHLSPNVPRPKRAFVSQMAVGDR